MIWEIIFYLFNYFKPKPQIIHKEMKPILQKRKIFYEEKPIKTNFLLLEKPKIKRSSSINDLDKKKMKKQKSV